MHFSCDAFPGDTMGHYFGHSPVDLLIPFRDRCEDDSRCFGQNGHRRRDSVCRVIIFLPANHDGPARVLGRRGCRQENRPSRFHDQSFERIRRQALRLPRAAHDQEIAMFGIKRQML
jgi:hypothetical protein